MDYQTWRKVFPDSEEAAKSAYRQCTSTIDLLGTETAKVKQLEAKFAELQRDADRYRWLGNPDGFISNSDLEYLENSKEISAICIWKEEGDLHNLPIFVKILPKAKEKDPLKNDKS